jgi:radical SAM enzyme (TIGR01210 family)
MLDQKSLDQVKIPLLIGGRRNWWDIVEGRMVSSATAYIPYGCPDWGETKGVRNTLCQFCGLPGRVAEYRREFYGDNPIPTDDHVRLFQQTLGAMCSEEDFHTLMIFNAGSFLAMKLQLQEDILSAVAQVPSIRRIVIESRAPLVTEKALEPLMRILDPVGKRLTIRIGVETKDDKLRLKVLKKGHTRKDLLEASACMKKFGVTSGGYVLLNPAPKLDAAWALQEAIDTLDWVLGDDGLAMDEVYLGPTCVSPNTPLAIDWLNGDFTPPSLAAVHRVLTHALAKHGPHVHLLRFKDEPPFLAVPSNDEPRGLPESLEGASDSDRNLHAMFDRFRDTMDPLVLEAV